MRKTFICFVGALVLGLGIQAMAAAPASNSAPIASEQNQSVSGRIVDAQGVPVIGASVLVKGTNIGTATDANGYFSVKAPASSTLVINCVGYKSTEVKGGTNLSLVLEEDQEMLEEVVVLGYGAQQKKQDLSASVGLVSDPQALAVRPVTSTQGMLQGQLAGVTVQNQSGDPTSTPSLVIRGQGSQNGDNVLWVVDGVPGAPIPSLYDIESIVVLKDAASAAIYGAVSGAGGCVLVTTKKASKTDGVYVSYEGTVGFRNAVKTIHGLNATDAVNVFTQSRGAEWLPSNAPQEFKDYIRTQRTDWTDAIYRTAVYQRHNVGLTFGNDVAMNRVSFAYNNDQGVLQSTYNQSMNAHYNGIFNITRWLTVSEDFNWSNGQSRGTNYTSDQTGVLLEAIAMPQNAVVYDEDGTYGGTMLQKWADAGYAGMWGDTVNPMRILEAENQWNRSSNIFTTTTLQIHDLIPGLKFTSRYSYSVNNYISKSFSPKRDEVGKANPVNSLTEYSSRSSKWMTENTLTYDKTFGKHTIGLLFSTTADKSSGFEFNGYREGFSDETPYMQYMAWGTGTPQITDGYSGPDTNLALIARAAYSFDDRYFITGSWRRDYAGRLPYDHNHGDFPGVTAAWKLSSEKFFQGAKEKGFNLFKIRGSWGRVGNLGSIPVSYSANVLTTENKKEGLYWGLSKGESFGTIVYNGKALNTALTWETSEQWDLGLDLAFCHDRFNLSVDYFNKSTFNLIQTQTTGWPRYMGINAPYVNQGRINNSGVEVELGWKDKVNKDFSYFINGNFTYLKNEVKETMLNADGTWADWIGEGKWADVDRCYRTTVGGPLNQFYLVESLGTIKTDEDLRKAQEMRKNEGVTLQKGDLWFVDQDGDGKITEKDRVYKGSSVPKYTYALNLGFTWKNLSFSAMFQGVAGAQVYYVGKRRILSDSDGKTNNRSTEIKNAWSESNPNSEIPRLTDRDDAKIWSTPSTYYLENGDYVRLKNVTLAYDFTSLIQKGLPGSTLSLYVSGENLATITKYSGMDPECGGYDTIKYPLSRTFSVGVKLGLACNKKKKDVEAMYAAVQPQPQIVEKVVEVEKIVEVPVVKEVVKEVVNTEYKGNGVHIVCFALGKSTLTAEAKAELDKVAGSADVVAFASPEGNPEFNKKLSEARAKAVADYLTSKGVTVKKAIGEGAPNKESNRIAIVTVK